MNDRSSTSRILTLTRLSSPRYLVFTAPMFLLGFIMAGAQDWSLFWLGIVGLLLWTAAQELANKVADRVEDEIDYPERTDLCRKLGYRNVGRAAWVFGALFVAWWIFMLPRIPVLASAWWLILLLGGILYSYGSRNKKRPLRSALAFVLTAPALLRAGWYLGGEGVSGSSALPSNGDVVLLAVLLFLAALSVKYTGAAPNVAGDSAIGFRSLYVRLTGGSNPLARTLGIKCVPYAAVVTAVLVGRLPVGTLAMLLLLPLAGALSAAMVRSRTTEERAAGRELGIVYLILLNGSLFLSVYPTGTTLAVIAGTLAWYCVATWWLHTEPALLTRERVNMVRRVVFGPSPAPG